MIWYICDLIADISELIILIKNSIDRDVLLSRIFNDKISSKDSDLIDDLIEYWYIINLLYESIR